MIAARISSRRPATVEKGLATAGASSSVSRARTVRSSSSGGSGVSTGTASPGTPRGARAARCDGQRRVEQCGEVVQCGCCCTLTIERGDAVVVLGVFDGGVVGDDRGDAAAEVAHHLVQVDAGAGAVDHVLQLVADAEAAQCGG